MKCPGVVTVIPLFEQLGPEGMLTPAGSGHGHEAAYEEAVRIRCPHAEIVYDLFHVVAMYGREVIEYVRVDEANRLRQDRTARQVIKGPGGCSCANPETVSR